MLVEISSQDFASLDDETLVLTCTEPTLQQYKGKDQNGRLQVFSQLTTGQKALWMFRVLYPAANNSVTEYSSWISNLIEQPNYWPGVTGGQRFFGETTMLQLLEGTKEVLEARDQDSSLQDDKKLQKCMGVFLKISIKSCRTVLDESVRTSGPIRMSS